MTDKYVLGKGRLYFGGLNLGEVTPLEAPYRATAKMAGDIYENFVNTALFAMRVTWIVGYNPQMLLPAPTFEREFMQSMSEWAREHQKFAYTEFANSVLHDAVTGDHFIRFDRKSDPSSPAYRMADYLTRIIKAMKPEEAPVLAIGSDLSALEHKALNYMYATFIHKSAGGSPTPRGRITLYDYDDRTVIELDGEGELPGVIDESFYLKGRYPERYRGPKGVITPLDRKVPAREHASPKRSQSYLDHDPTKRHGRRKKK